VLNAQLEAGAFATTYIPTTAAAATRATDLATIPTTPWFNAAQGTLAFDGNIPTLTGGTFTFTQISDGTSTNRIAQRTTSTVTEAFYLVANAVTATASTGAIVAGANFKAAAALLPGSLYGTVNGGAVISASGAPPGGMTTLRLGNSFATNQALNGYVQRVRYWSIALSAAQLQAITQ
jgi:hypothetical protein